MSAPILVAISGPLRGAIFKLGADAVSIGRHPSNDLCIGDFSVSRRHSLIKAEPDGYAVEDLGSHNGTFVNSQRVDRAPLRYGDTIGIGNTLLRLQDEEATGELPQEVPERELIARATLQLAPEQAALLRDECALQLAEDRPSRELEFFMKIGGLIQAAKDVGVLGSHLLETIQAVVPFERGIILAARPGAPSECAPVATWGDSTQGHVQLTPAGDVIEQAIRTGVATIAEVCEVPGTEDGYAIAVPLALASRVAGFLYLTGNQRWTPHQVCLLAAASPSIALALDHAMRSRLATVEVSPAQKANIKHVMIGTGPRISEVYQRIGRIARTDATVLIRGETGTGKELAARAIHQNSPRANRPFEAINCALLKDTLLDSELFGHEKGAFTGAMLQKRGKLELADGGTLFLDEVGELGEGPQSMLLRVLQERCFQRLGGSRTIDVDIRIIAATNRDLEEAIRNKTFREDLYYRLNVVSLRMPPLRERRQDIAALAEHFVIKYSKKHQRLVRGISPEAMIILETHDWPGNVRELENAIEYAVIFGCCEEILPEDLPDILRCRSASAEPASFGYQEAVREAKRAIVLNALTRANGNFTKAAKMLDIHVNNLHRLVREFNLRSALSA